ALDSAVRLQRRVSLGARSRRWCDAVVAGRPRAALPGDGEWTAGSACAIRIPAGGPGPVGVAFSMRATPWRLQRHPCFEAIRIGKAVGSPPSELAGYRQRLMTLPIGWPVIPSCSACLR